MEFKHFFNCYDTVGQQHTGFLQSMDFSALEESVTFLNELTWAFMDAYLYNELSGSMVMRQWGQYMHYSRENERFEIMSTFYQDFVNAVAAKLMRAEKWYQLTKVDFTSLSATDIKTIQHGSKETQRDYGQDETTNVYGQQEDTNVYGAREKTQRFGDLEETNIYGKDETETVYGQKNSQLTHGQQTITKNYDAVVVSIERDNDTHIIGQTQTDTDTTTTNKLYPLGASAYIDDTQNVVDSTTQTAQQSNTDQWGDQTNSTAARRDEEGHASYMDTTLDNQHTDSETRKEHTDVHSIDQHTNVTEDATHTDTVTSATHTDTKTRDARRDTEQIKAYTDQETHVKHIVISPEKYYQIEKELTEIGVYDLMKDAVKETMLLCVWEGGYLW